MAIAPTASSSLSIGTLSNVRILATSTARRGSWSPSTYDGSSRMSAMCTGARVLMTPANGTFGEVRCSAPFRQCSSVKRGVAEGFDFQQPHNSAGLLAKPGPIRQHGLEHRVELASRGADDAQHL